jgi:hypothetical protein
MTKINENNDFQVNILEYKLKKIKKKKNNYKCKNNNIEKFEILKNIPENNDENETNLENSNNSYENNNVSWYNQTKKKSAEGFENMAFPDILPKEIFNSSNAELFDGNDDYRSQDGNDNKPDNTITLVDIINEIYFNIITFNCYIAFSFVYFITDKTNDTITNINESITWDFIQKIIILKNDSNLNPITGGKKSINPNIIKDSNVVYNYICLIESLISAYVFTFVWFYIIIYNFFTDNEQPNIFDYLNTSNFKDQENIVIKILFFIFEYSLVTLELFRMFIEKIIPEYTSFLSKSLLFLILFYIIFNINFYSISYFKNLLINIIKGDLFSNPLTIVFYIFVFGEYIKKSGLYEMISNKSPGEKEGEKKEGGEEKGQEKGEEKAEEKGEEKKEEKGEEKKEETPIPMGPPNSIMGKATSAMGNMFGKKKGGNKSDPLKSLMMDNLKKSSKAMMPGSNVWSILITILQVVLEVIRVLTIYFVAIPVGLVLCLIYFLWVSIITNFGVINPTVISNIISFIKDDFNYRKDNGEDPCNSNSSFLDYLISIAYKVLNILIYVPLIIFNILPFFMILFYCVYVIMNCFKVIKGPKKQLFYIHIIFLCMAILNLKSTFDGYLRADNKLGFSVLFSPPIEEQCIYFFSVFTGIFTIIFLLIFLFFLLFIKHIFLDLIDDNGNSGAAIIILMNGFVSGINNSYKSLIKEFSTK